MNEMIKDWLKELYKGEIDQELGTISNERVWANGADTQEVAQMHLDNVALHEEYVAVLKEKLEELDK